MEKEIGLDKVSPKIAVMGVGGAGGNAVDNMIRSDLRGVSFFVCNTDAQALTQSLCPEEDRIRMGFGITQGLGAGSCPEFGQAAAKESIDDILKKLDGVHMLFVTAGMGGGTGTGASPVIAAAAREKGILTVGVVTKPFHFEGSHRMSAAEKGISVLRECVDTLLVIPNQNLFRIADQNTTFAQAFSMADDVLFSGVKTFTDLMLNPGLVNCDFADIGTVMRNTKGRAMMGAGTASGESRATEAAEKAIGGLLLDHASLGGAQSLLINVTGGSDLRLYDVDEAIGRVKKELTHDVSGCDTAHIIFGATFDEAMEGSIRVSVVATGIQDQDNPKDRDDLTSSKEDHSDGVHVDDKKDALIDDRVFSFDDKENFDMHKMGSRHHDFFSFSEEGQDSMHDVLKEESEETFGQDSFAFDSSFVENGLDVKKNAPEKKKKEWMHRIVKLIKGDEMPTIMPTPRYDTSKKDVLTEEDTFEGDLPAFLQHKGSGRE
jgi:cell division protein FtsZ